MLHDLRYAIRMLLKHRGLAAVSIVSLALGIGVNTTIFSFVNALLLQPPAVEAPAQLLELWNKNPKADSDFERYSPLSYPDYAYFRDHQQVFSGMLAFDGDPAFLSWSRTGQGEMIQGQLVSGNFFSLLGVKAAFGRTFFPEEDQTPGAHPVVILSYRFWRQRFSGSPELLGTPLTLNGQKFTVIGVAPEKFTSLLAGIAPDVWLPLVMAPQITGDSELLANRGSHWLFAVGRLKHGVGLLRARADADLLALQISQAHPDDHQKLGAAVFRATLVPGPYRGYVGAFTGLLMIVVALILAIAGVNAANFLLAQTVDRRREMVIRYALGANRARLMRQTLVESVLLALLSGAAGLVLAFWTVPLLLHLKPPTVPIRLDIPADYRVFGFTFLVSLLAGLLLGMVPAWRGTKLNLTQTLKDEGRSGGRGRARLSRFLVAGQIALCLTLLACGGLCLRSLHNAQSIDPGFETRQRLSATVDVQTLNYSKSQAKAVFSSWIERVRALPGVESVGLASHLPLETTSMGLAISIPGYEPPRGQDEIGIAVADVSSDYFKAMGIPVLKGREFTRQDSEGSQLVVIINEAMAERFWPGRDPTGLSFTIGDLASGQRYRIVGVVKTGRYQTLSENPQPFMYRSILQHYHPKATLIAHTSGSPLSLLAAVRRELQTLDPNLVLIQLSTLEQHLAFALFPARTTGILLGVFGLLALVLSVIGLSGVVTHSVSQRTHEIGIRMALGAQRQEILRLVMKQAMEITLAGWLLGLGFALGLTRFLSSLLYGIQPTDRLTFTAASLLLIVVAALASYIPARRATKVDPLVALRYE